MKIVFATCAEMPEILPSDQLLAKALEAKGAEVSGAPWSGPFEPFAAADLVMIRSTWDYFDKVPAFLSWLDALEESGATVLNSLEILRWNAVKDYLFELQANGVKLIPTKRVDANIDDIQHTADEAGWDSIVVKCLASGSAAGLSLIDPSDRAACARALEDAAPYLQHGLMIQPFLSQITTSGELSLLFFGGEFSHAVRKTPRENEFRVQAAFGGRYQPVKVDDATLESARRIISHAPGMPDAAPTYARVDGVLIEGQFHLMEIELTEPELMLDLNPEAPQRLAEIVLGSLR